MKKVFYSLQRIQKRIFLLFPLIFAIGTDCVSEPQNNHEKVILVFDASGSMWGQIDGKTKIEIAKAAVGDLIVDWPENKELGLMAYGHRDKGDCNDIEMLIPVGKLDKDAFKATINKISPKGKTPLSESVKRAAHELRFTEDKATVILLSDGIETCNLDPCEIGKSLEEQGIDFTAHVIGFDVNNLEDQKGLKCLAENTGGKFIAAKDAKELQAALKAVKEREPTPTPAPVIPEATITAPIEAIKGTEIETKNLTETPLEDLGYVYLVLQGKEKAAGSGKVEKSETGTEMFSKIRLPIVLGEYDLLWKTKDDTVLAKTTIKVIDAPIVINGPTEAVAGTEVKLDVDAPQGLKGYVYIYKKGSDKPISHEAVREGTDLKYEQLKFRLPSVTGEYVFKFKANSEEVLAEKEILLTEAKVGITTSDEAIAGTEVPLDVNAPPGLTGYVYIYKKGSDKQISHSQLHEGTSSDYETIKFRLPGIPGDYTFKLKSRAGEMLAERDIKLTEVGAQIVAPDSAIAGTEIELNVEAPPKLDAYVYIFKKGSDKPISHNLIAEGLESNYKPIKFRLPAIPGDFVFKLKTRAGAVLAEKEINLTEVGAQIIAPESAIAGTEIEVNVEAPPKLDAYVYIFKKGSDKQISHSLISEGTTTNYNPIKFRLPAIPGDYLFKLKTRSGEVLTEKAINLTNVTAELVVPAEALAGTEVEVNVEAPPKLDAYVYLFKKGSEKEVSYNLIREGSTTNYETIKFRLPATPGDYVFKLKTRSGEILTEREIKLTELTAKLISPAEASAGEEVALDVEAPEGLSAYVYLYPKGSDKQISYQTLREGKSFNYEIIKFTLPATPGEFVFKLKAKTGEVLAENPLVIKEKPTEN